MMWDYRCTLNIMKLFMRNSGYFYFPPSLVNRCEKGLYKDDHKPYMCVQCNAKKFVKILLMFIQEKGGFWLG